ncbi:hypothetical protein B0H13DRAFT_1889453 [Mycena leptocephala]|nr:hypothetical protein B0H13DRAFT_1889453 [Mycena leptocephala]
MTKLSNLLAYASVLIVVAMASPAVDRDMGTCTLPGPGAPIEPLEASTLISIRESRLDDHLPQRDWRGVHYDWSLIEFLEKKNSLVGSRKACFSAPDRNHKKKKKKKKRKNYRLVGSGHAPEPNETHSGPRPPELELGDNKQGGVWARIQREKRTHRGNRDARNRGTGAKIVQEI